MIIVGQIGEILTHDLQESLVAILEIIRNCNIEGTVDALDRLEQNLQSLGDEMERVLMQSISHNDHQLVQKVLVVKLKKLKRELRLTADILHDCQKSLKSDSLNLGLVMLDGPDYAIDDGLKLLTLQIEENLEAILGHGLDQQEEVLPVLWEGGEVLGDHWQSLSENNRNHL